MWSTNCGLVRLSHLFLGDAVANDRDGGEPPFQLLLVPVRDASVF